MSNNASSRQTTTNHVKTATLRNKKLNRRAPASHQEAILPPSREVLRRAIEAQTCPFCGRGPFRMIAAHVSKIHGLSPDELRKRAGLTYSASICSPEHAAARSEQQKATGVVPPPRTYGSPRRLSEAAKQANRDKLEAVRSPEQMKAALEAAHSPEAKEKRKATRRAKVATYEHGTYRMYHQLGCRCEACTAANTAYFRTYRTGKKA